MRASLAADLERYRRSFPTTRWLDSTTWHLTLVFIGSVPATTVAALREACDEVAAARPPFGIDLQAGGGRIQRGDGVAWLSVATNAGRVIELADEATRIVERALGSVAAPRRAMSAHLTVARRADERLIGTLRKEELGPLRGALTADRITLMRSHLGRSGASYERLHEAPLQGTSEP